MSIEIKKITEGLGTSTKISQLNDMILQLNGMLEQGRFDTNEIEVLFDDFGLDRKFLRNQSIGHTLATYTGWTHHKAESGYSIWKFAPTNYAYNLLNKLFFDNKLIDNMGEATAETSAFDKVYLYNGSTYEDNTTEAGTEEGTEFELMDDVNDYLYMGLSSTFAGIKFEFQTTGTNYGLKIEYYNGAWVELTVNDDDLVDNTNDFASDGLISWTIPDDWATVAVNSVTKYWIRISTTTEPITPAQTYYIVPGNSVESLLALSSSQFLDEDWKFCSYNDYIYVTIKNEGNTAYEGDAYIKSSSSATNKQNFFIYNHEFKADYEDDTYVLGSLEISSISQDDSSIQIVGESGDGYIIFVEDSSEIMRITGGNVGIGTTSPDFKLDVNGDIRIEEAHKLYFGSVSGGGTLGNIYHDGTDFLFSDSIRATGDVRLSGNVTDGTNASSPANIKSAVDLKHTQNTDSKIIVGDTSVEITDAGDGYIVFKEDNVEYMRLTGGKLGIGIDAPETKLHIAKSAGDESIFFDVYSTGSHLPTLVFRRSHHNTIGTKITTINGEYIGEIAFRGVDDGNNVDQGAQITVIQDGTAGVKIPCNMYFQTYSATAINTNQLVLHNDGRIGIGNDTPYAKLDIGIVDSTWAGYHLHIGAERESVGITYEAFGIGVGVNLINYVGRGTISSPEPTQTDDNILTIYGQGYTNARKSAGLIKIEADTGWGTTGNDSPGRISFWTSPDGSSTPLERLTIKSNGRIGIGTITPQTTLDIGISDSEFTGYGLHVGGDSGLGSIILGVASDTPTVAPNLLLQKYRGTHASRNITAVDDVLGNIAFRGYTTGGYTRNACAIRGECDTGWSTSGANDAPGRLIFLTTPDGSATPTEKLRIGSANIITATADIHPGTDDSYYLGKNSISTPKAYKGVILKDTTNGNYYRIEIINGAVTATQIT